MNFRQALLRFDIETWLKRFSPKPYGNERAVTCPVCEKKEKLWVSLTKRLATCYYCESGYNLFDLVMLLEDCSMAQAVEVVLANTTAVSPTKSLVKSVGKRLQRAKVELAEDDAPPVVPLPTEFVAYETATRVPKYFRERGISRKRAVEYGLGWCERGFYANRLVVPVIFDGKCRGFHPRWMKKVPPPGVKKVVYPKGMKSSQLLFDWDRVKRKPHVIICEDPFSAMAVGGTATFGTSLSPMQLRMLLNAEPERVTFLWDLDALKKAHSSAAKLQSEGVVSDVVELPDERDPDEMPHSELAVYVANAESASLVSAIRARLR